MTYTFDPESRRVSRYGTCPVPDCDQFHVPNVPMLRKVYEHITQHPDAWDQERWGTARVDFTKRVRDSYGRFTRPSVETACKTAFCFAGHTVQMTGYEFQVAFFDPFTCEDGVFPLTKALEMCQENKETGDFSLDTVYLGDPEVTEAVPVLHVAAHELGLTWDEADRLFNAHNCLQEIKNYCTNYAALVGERF